MKTVTLLLCYTPVGTTSSFSFNIFENPVSNFVLVNESVVKLTEGPNSYWHGLILIKNKVNPLFPNVGIRGKAMQILFFHSLTLHNSLLSSDPSLSFGICVDLLIRLSLHYSGQA